MPTVARVRTASPSAKVHDAARVSSETRCFYAEGAVVAMATSHNSTMWLAMQDGRVEVRDMHTGQVVHTFAVAGVRQRRNKVWCMLSVYDVVHQEAQLWMGLSSGAIEVYTESYQLRRQLSKHLSGVYCLAQYRGDVAYAGSSDFTITQWRVADGRLLRVLTGHSNYVRCLYAEGNALVSGSDDNTVRVWDTASGTSLQQYSHLHHESGGVSALCRVGTAMWSGDQSGVIAVWKLKDGEVLLVCRQVKGRVISLRKVGARVYAGSAEGRIYVFNAGDFTVVNHLDDHMGSSISAIACAVEVNRYFVWSGSADNTIQCWHHDEHQPMTAEREGALDMQWYYTTQLPYLQSNEALLEQQRELAELVVLSSGSDDAVRSFFDSLEGGQETAAARHWLLDNKVKQMQKRYDTTEEVARNIGAAIERKTHTLEMLRRQLALLTEALSSARQRPSAPASSAAAVSALPGGTPVPARPAASEPPAVPAGVSPSPATVPQQPDASVLSPSSLLGTAVPLRPATFVSAHPHVPSPPPLATTGAAAPLSPPPPSSLVIPPPPPASVVPAPMSASLPPPSAKVPAPERPPSSSSSPYIVTEAHVTLSRSYEPVLSSLPPPPKATVPPPPVAAVPTPPPTRNVGTLGELPAKTTAPSLTRRMSF